MMKQEEKVLSYITEQEVQEFLQALIRARSDNPPGDTRAAAKVCMDKFQEYGTEGS